jgi:hypothetical protein
LTRRKPQIVWKTGLFSEAVLIGATVAADRRASADFDRRWGRFTNGSAAATPLQRDSALRLLRDQTGISVEIRNDTIVAVHASPATERAFGATLARISSDLAVAAVLALAIYLAIPMALLIITMLWYRAHRGAPPLNWR